MLGSARDMQGVRERRRGTSRVRNDFSPISGVRASLVNSPIRHGRETHAYDVAECMIQT